MKTLLSAMFVALLMAGCGETTHDEITVIPESLQSPRVSAAARFAEIGESDWADHNETVREVIALAIDGDQLEQRGVADEELFYALGESKPFTGWAKWMDGNGDRLVKGLRLKGFKEGKEHGTSMKWYESGRKLYQISCRDGEWEGVARWWWENGPKRAERTFREGKMDGLSVRWYESGRKKEEVTYKDGKYDGLMTEWRDNGRRKFERSYRQGKPNGVEVRFREDGSVASRTTWEDGKRVETTLVRPPKKFPLSLEEASQWAEWEANPEPYGGLDALAMIREVKERGEKKLDLSDIDQPSRNITDLTPLALLTDLEDLDLRGNQITDLSPLNGLVKLQALYLSANQISDLKPLTALTNLSKLRLSFNHITDVKPLAKLTNLRDLWLMGNQVTDVAPLMGLTKLRELNLRDNPLPEVQKARVRKVFRKIFSLFMN